MNFEWDESKNQKNILKHGIDFEDAAKVFFSKRLEKRSDQHSEVRFITIGQVFGRVIAVIYTRRQDNIRIISARKTRKNEQKAYYSKRDHK